MLQYDFERSVGYWIFATAHELACAMNEKLQSLGITYRQWEVLAWLSFEQGLSQTELAERMGIESPTLVGVLDRMERDGWIQRIPSETDRRKKIIRTTDKVEPAWSRMMQCGLEVRNKATAGLTEAQLDMLREVLSTIRDNLQAGPISRKARTQSPPAIEPVADAASP